MSLHSSAFTPRRLGEAARRAAARRLAALWPHADGLDVLGVGYPAPYLDAFAAARAAWWR